MEKAQEPTSLAQEPRRRWRRASMWSGFTISGWMKLTCVAVVCQLLLIYGGPAVYPIQYENFIPGETIQRQLPLQTGGRFIGAIIWRKSYVNVVYLGGEPPGTWWDQRGYSDREPIPWETESPLRNQIPEWATEMVNLPGDLNTWRSIFLVGYGWPLIILTGRAVEQLAGPWATPAWRDGIVLRLNDRGFPNILPGHLILLPFCVNTVCWTLAIAAIAQMGKHAIRWNRRRNGQCDNCGYDLTGNQSGKCPECGTESVVVVKKSALK